MTASRLALLVSFGLLPATAVAAPASPRTLVVCAPGYPGTTAAAQPTMDAFAKISEKAAGWPAGSLRAVYFESAEGGVKRLEEPDAVLALVSLPFFLRHEADLGLAARLQVVQETGAAEIWSLAARRGKITSPAALDGWEITGSAGLDPEFVRGPILGAWGRLPESVSVTYTANVLSALLRAASDEPVVVVVDEAQAKSIGSLPFGENLEIVTRSQPMPGALVCTVGTRLAPKQAGVFARGLERLHGRPESEDVLKTMRMERFGPVDTKSLDAARRSFAEARGRAKTAP